MYWVYIIRCRDGSYYTGVTRNLASRVDAHNSGAVSGFTHNRRPVELFFAQPSPTIIEAILWEKQIKGWTRAKKEALARGDYATLKQLSKNRYKGDADKDTG